MIQKYSSRTALLCIIMCFVLFAVLFSGSTVQADGGGSSTWPDESTDPTSSTDNGGGIDGIEAMIAVSNLVQLIL